VALILALLQAKDHWMQPRDYATTCKTQTVAY